MINIKNICMVQIFIVLSVFFILCIVVIKGSTAKVPKIKTILKNIHKLAKNKYLSILRHRNVDFRIRVNILNYKEIC